VSAADRVINKFINVRHRSAASHAICAEASKGCGGGWEGEGGVGPGQRTEHPVARRAGERREKPFRRVKKQKSVIRNTQQHQ